MESAIIDFTKIGKEYKITNYESVIDLSSITDMSQFIFEQTNTLSLFFSEEGNYRWIGTVEKKRVRHYATMRAFFKLS